MAGRIALFPGSFDPFTLGHLDVVTTAARLFDSVHIAIGVNSAKLPFLSVADRLAAIEESVREYPNVDVGSFRGLVVDYGSDIGATVIVRGLRQSTDFDYEQRMAVANRTLDENLPTVFLTPKPKNLLVSSTIVRDIYKYGGDVSHFVPQPVLDLINQKRKSELQ